MTLQELIRTILDAVAEYDQAKAEDAIDAYAKQESISFSIFKREYQLIQGMNVRMYNIEKYGTPVAISWIGDSDNLIWDAYKSGKQLERRIPTKQ